jgi:subtilisin family serine protease
MRRTSPLLIIAVLAILLVFFAGCTSTTSSPATPATVAPALTSGAAGAVPANGAAATPAPGIDTTIAVRYNDYTCINIPQTMGVDYLNTGENYTVQVTTPGAGTITPNLLVVNDNDNLKFSTVTPEWDPVQKTWTYNGIVPLVKLIDIISPQSAMFSIKNQGWYFLCIDDRKENGASTAIYQVPVEVTRA